jgi:hypothetical protein
MRRKADYAYALSAQRMVACLRSEGMNPLHATTKSLPLTAIRTSSATAPDVT